MPSSLDQSNEVGVVLRSISDRLADRPEYELARQQLNLAYQGPLVAAQPADACGNRLLDADLLDEATTLYRALVRCFADQPVGFVGLARLAMRRNAWTDALACWDEVINRFAREARPLWRAQRATALLHLGRRAEAEQAFRMLIRTNPEFLPGLLGLLRTLLFMGERERAFLELDASSFCRVDAPALVWTKFEILIGLHRLDDARTEFDRILRAAEDPTLLTSLFAFAPQLYDGWRRTKAWLTLLEKTESFAKRNRIGAEPLDAIRLRILLALRSYDQFLAEITVTSTQRDLGYHRASLLAVAAALRESSFPDYRKPKIFGIGLSRTGTTSLAAALGGIGFNTVHWFNPLTCELISDDDIYLFDAFTDTPVCVQFEKYYHMFPGSKFIYTGRSLEQWKRSVIGHFKRLTGASDFQEFKAALDRPDWLPFGTAFSRMHHTLYFNYSDYESAYQAFDRRVRQFFQDKPKDRFLEFDLFAGHGWPELCAFTGRAMPSAQYPLQNPMTSEPELSCPYVDASSDRRRVFGL